MKTLSICSNLLIIVSSNTWIEHDINIFITTICCFGIGNRRFPLITPIHLKILLRITIGSKFMWAIWIEQLECKYLLFDIYRICCSEVIIVCRKRFCTLLMISTSFIRAISTGSWTRSSP